MKIIIGLAVILVILVIVAWVMDGGISDALWYIDESKKARRDEKYREESQDSEESNRSGNGLRWEHGAFVNEAPMPESFFKRHPDWVDPDDD